MCVVGMGIVGMGAVTDWSAGDVLEATNAEPGAEVLVSSFVASPSPGDAASRSSGTVGSDSAGSGSAGSASAAGSLDGAGACGSPGGAYGGGWYEDLGCVCPRRLS